MGDSPLREERNWEGTASFRSFEPENDPFPLEPFSNNPFSNNCFDTATTTSSNNSEHQQQQQEFGNEENCAPPPKDFASTSEEQQQQEQERSLKKMRTGGTPNKNHRRRPSSEVSSHSATTNSATFLLLDAASDNDTNNNTNHQSSAMKMPPPQSHHHAPQPHNHHSNNAATSPSDAGTSSTFASRRQWLDQFGKQHQEDQQHSKDPRFASLAASTNLNKRRASTSAAAPMANNSSSVLSSTRRASAMVTTSSSTGSSPAPFQEPGPVLLAPVFPMNNNSSPSFTSARMPNPSSAPADRGAFEVPALQPSSSRDSSTSSMNSGHSGVTVNSALTSTTTSTASSMASALVKRLVDKGGAPSSQETTKARLHRHHHHITGTPVRIKPRVRSQEVQATDQGYASVAKLSAWLADDPTSAKKLLLVRRGANVIAKSRRFEKDLENVIVEENSITTGSVRDKKSWFRSVFSEEDEDAEEYDHHDEHHDQYHFTTTRHTMRTPVMLDDGCARSEFVVGNDAASTISVNNKKKWLENAFKSEGGPATTIGTAMPHYKAKSDIGTSRDDITSRAKQMWQQKSERRSCAAGRTDERPPTSAQKPRRASAMTVSQQQQPALLHHHNKPPASPWKHNRPHQDPTATTTPHKQQPEDGHAAMTMTSTQPQPRIVRGGPTSTRSSAPSILAMALDKSSDDNTQQQVAAATKKTEPALQTRQSVAGTQMEVVEEDVPSVDFRAARALLIRRSKKNGNELKIASKVQRRTEKFEKLDQQSKRRSMGSVLLKPSWEANASANSSVTSSSSSSVSLSTAGGPSISYTKSLVPDVAPKRSFEQLP